MKYQDVYKNCVNMGYHVTSVRDYVDNNNGRLNSEIHMQTPYFNKDKEPIMGYAVVPVTHERGNVLRDANTVEFWTKGHNMDYMSENETTMYDANGTIVDMNKEREVMRQFAAAVSEYPHVATWDEYKPLQERNLARLHMDADVTQADYSKYLDKKLHEMRQGVEFIGENSTKSDVARLYDSVREDHDISDEVLDDMAKSFGDDGMSF
jgi:hypothetical protein